MSADYSALETLLKELIATMGFEVTLSQQSSQIAGQNGIVFHINAPEHSHLLIGQHGINLEALQHTFRVLARKRLGTDIPPFALDVNNYWQDKSVTLIREAREAAELAARDRSTQILRPMTAFERKIVHAALTDFPGVETESTGHDEARKVVIKPTSLLEA
jgi:spoIIIJ-associated protein